jgi:hypothetical protein
MKPCLLFDRGKIARRVPGVKAETLSDSAILLFTAQDIHICGAGTKYSQI